MEMEEECEDRVYLEIFKALLLDLLTPFCWLVSQLMKLAGTALVWAVWLTAVVVRFLGSALITPLYMIGWLILMILTYVLVMCLWLMIRIWIDYDIITGQG